MPAPMVCVSLSQSCPPVDLLLVPGDVGLLLEGGQAAQRAELRGGPLALGEARVPLPAALLKGLQPPIHLLGTSQSGVLRPGRAQYPEPHIATAVLRDPTSAGCLLLLLDLKGLKPPAN